MYSLLIADDDPAAREGLRALPLWRRLGVDDIETAADGAEALARLRAKMPDLLLTDVKMPRMDGVALAREARALSGALKIVFISGYDDVSYIKSALTVNACDYIMKPVELRALEDCMQRAVNQLEREEKWNVDFEKLRRQAQAGEKVIRSNLLGMLIHNRLDEGELAGALAALGIPDGGETLWVFAVRAEGCENVLPLLSAPGELRPYAFPVDLEKGLYALVARGDASREAARNMAAERLEALRRAGAEYACAGMCERPAAQLTRFRACYESALYSLAHGFYRAPFQTVAFEPRPAATSMPDFHIASELCAGSDADFDARAQAITEGMRRARIAEPAPYLRAFQALSREVMDAFCAKFGFVAEDEALSPERALNDMAKKCCLDDMAKVFFEYARAVRRVLLYDGDATVQLRVKRAAEYIRAHLSLPLTVSDIASEVYLAPAYLCVLFRRETGATINAFITRERMETAKKLLSDVSLKQYDICLAIGYQNPSYFTRQFKRYTGLTPTEYRNTRGKGRL